jgi:predicted MFS family arabinose efflux permease
MTAVSLDSAEYSSTKPSAALVVAWLLGVIGASTPNVLPLLVAGATHSLGFSDRQVSLLSSSISIGLAASALFATLWIRSVSWPLASLCALLGMLVTNLLGMFVHGQWTFIFLQGAAAFCGGSVACLSATILSDRPQPVRGFGVSMALLGASQVGEFLAGPVLLRAAGLNGVLAMVAVVSGLGVVVAPRLLPRGRIVITTHVPKAFLRPATLIGLLGMCAFFVNGGAYWTYLEPMGEARGLTARVVGNCIAGGAAAGVLGGIFAWVLGDRIGRLSSLGLATFLMLTAALLLNTSLTLGAFVGSCLLSLFATNYSLAYQLAAINAVDASGRAVAVSSAFAYFGMAAGAALAGLWVTPGNYHAVIWIVVASVCLSMVLFILSSAVHKRTVMVFTT